MAVIKMGNRMLRPHARYSAAGLRARYSKEVQNEEGQAVYLHLTKTLYNSGSKGQLLSFSDYKTTGSPKVLEIGLSVHRDSVRLISDDLGLKGLSLTLDTKEEMQVTVFYFAKEIIDSKTKAQYLSLAQGRSPQQTSVKVSPGLSQEILIAPNLDLSKFTDDECKFKDHRTFPIVIFIKGKDESALYYYKIEGERVVKVRETYTVGEKTHEVLDLYGDSTQDCTVCLSDCSVMMAMPCRHVCLCEKCFNNLMERERKCPVCRTKIISGFQLHG